MPLQNKNKIAWLSALTLFFSYLELLLPKFVPFFRLGLSNLVILSALTLDFPSFVILCLIKSLAASVLNGTLISPFFIISLSQSLISGLVMYSLFRLSGKRNLMTLYGLSTIGSAVSCFVQLALSSIYLGSTTFALTGPMLIFSMIAAFITSAGAYILCIPEASPSLIESPSQSCSHNSLSQNKVQLVCLVLFLISAVLVLAATNLYFLAFLLLLAFIFQLICGRKIKLLPHINIWIFVIVCCLLSPSGKVWFKIGRLSITEGAFLQGLGKAIKLSTVAAISQCAATLRPGKTSLLSQSLNYFAAITNTYKNLQGNIFTKAYSTIHAEQLFLTEQKQNQKNPLVPAILLCTASILLFILDLLCR